MVLRQFMLVAARDALTPTIPTAPSGVNATLITDNDVRVDWVDNSNNETGFKVSRNKDGGTYSVINTTAVNVITYQDNNVDYDSTYCYKVAATNATGDSAEAGPDCISTDSDPGGGDPPACDAPTAPSGMAATTASSTSISLVWVDNSDDETGFEIFMDGASEKSVGAGSTSTTISGLAEGTSFAFKVRAVKTTCSPTKFSGFSNTDSAFTKLASPSGMGFVDFREDCPGLGGFVRLSWSENSSNEANIELYKDGGLDRTMAANSTTIDIQNASAPGAWKVRAVHSTIPDSSFSNTTTVPNCP